MGLAGVTFALGDAFDRASLAAVTSRPTIAVVSGLIIPFGAYLVLSEDPRPETWRQKTVLLGKEDYPVMEAEGRGRILGRFARLHQAQHEVRHPHSQG